MIKLTIAEITTIWVVVISFVLAVSYQDIKFFLGFLAFPTYFTYLVYFLATQK